MAQRGARAGILGTVATASLLETARAARPDHLIPGTTQAPDRFAEVVSCPFGPVSAKWRGAETVALLGPNNRTLRTLSAVTKFQPAQLHFSAGCEYLVSLDGHFAPYG